MNFHELLKEADSGLVQSKKSKVKIVASIKDGTRDGSPGTVFSTPKSKRIYVITHQKWGKKKPISGNQNVYKGFSADTPLEDIKGYAERTKAKFGGKEEEKDSSPRPKFKSLLKTSIDFGELFQNFKMIEDVLCKD